MPRGTVVTEFGERIYLTSLNDPDDPGYVRLRPLPYGMRLEMRDRASRMFMEQNEARKGRKGRVAQEEKTKFEIETVQRSSKAFEMGYCIGEHNILDANDRLLDFSDPRTLDILDPRVGAEIEELLDELNGEETDESLENFIKQATTSLPQEAVTKSPTS